MEYEQVEALIDLTPIKIIAKNLQQVAQAIEESYTEEDTVKVKDLVHTGNQLLNAIDKLN